MLRLGALPLLLLIPYALFAASYYGDPLPNTYYVKVAGDWQARVGVGLGYSLRYLVSPPFGVMAAAMLAALALARRGARKFSRDAAYLAWLIALYLAAISFVGGDHMASFRLFLPLVPMASLLVFVLLRELVPNERVGAVAGVYAIAFGLSALQLASQSLNPSGPDAAAVTGKSVARYIARCWPAGSTVALNTAGSTPFYADGHHYIDMLGLNDRTIGKRRISYLTLDWQKVPGHAKGDGRYVLSREPHFIIIGPASGDVIDHPWFLSDFEMAQDPSFRRKYTLRQVALELPQAGKLASGDRQLFWFRYYQRVDDPAISCEPADR